MTAPAISVDGIRKSYGPTVALDGASFQVAAGSVHALLGENGAGKSTMVKLLSGLVRPDGGRMQILGATARFRGPRDAHRAGVRTAFQELTLVPTLTVAETVWLPYEPVGWFGQVRRRQAERTVVEHLERLGIEGVSPRQEIQTLGLALRQKLEIARALLSRPKILLLDEPTSALTGVDIDWLDRVIAAEKARGTTIVFISHRTPEVRRFCDAFTILRNGATVGRFAVGDVSDDEVIDLIVLGAGLPRGSLQGRSLAATFPPRPALNRETAPVLEVRTLAARSLEDVSFALRPGEIVGVAGLQGMGQVDLFLSLFGDLASRAGTVLLDGRPIVLGSPQQAIEAGIGLVPEDRKSEALFLTLDARRNASLPVLGRFARRGLIDDDLEARAVEGALRRVQVDARAMYTPAGAFSGGNQQKIVLAKWLLTGCRVLLLFDPTRGVDVGTKHEIYVLIHDYVRAGGAVLLYSSEITEVVNLSHRVLVLYRGRVAAELDGTTGSLTEPAIMRAALGHSPADRHGSAGRDRA